MYYVCKSTETDRDTHTCMFGQSSTRMYRTYGRLSLAASSLVPHMTANYLVLRTRLLPRIYRCETLESKGEPFCALEPWHDWGVGRPGRVCQETFCARLACVLSNVIHYHDPLVHASNWFTGHHCVRSPPFLALRIFTAIDEPKPATRSFRYGNAVLFLCPSNKLATMPTIFKAHLGAT